MAACSALPSFASLGSNAGKSNAGNGQPAKSSAHTQAKFKPAKPYRLTIPDSGNRGPAGQRLGMALAAATVLGLVTLLTPHSHQLAAPQRKPARHRRCPVAHPDRLFAVRKKMPGRNGPASPTGRLHVWET
jgi:hypothetical protein